MEITETHFNKTERKNSPKKVRKNDGNLTLGEKAKHFGKGMLRGITSLFTDENGDFSVKQTLKTVGTAVIVTAAASAVVAAGIVSAPVMAIGLVGTGVVTVSYTHLDVYKRQMLRWSELECVLIKELVHNFYFQDWGMVEVVSQKMLWL